MTTEPNNLTSATGDPETPDDEPDAASLSTSDLSPFTLPPGRAQRHPFGHPIHGSLGSNHIGGHRHTGPHF